MGSTSCDVRQLGLSEHGDDEGATDPVSIQHDNVISQIYLGSAERRTVSISHSFVDPTESPPSAATRGMEHLCLQNWRRRPPGPDAKASYLASSVPAPRPFTWAVPRIWHIDKKINGERLYEGTEAGDREEAERYLIFRLEQIRQQKVYGVKKIRIWREATTRFLLEFKDQPSTKLSAHHLPQLDPFIGDMPLTLIDDQALVPFIKDRLAAKKLENGKVKKGVSNRTVNISIERVVRVLSCVPGSGETMRRFPSSSEFPSKLQNPPCRLAGNNGRGLCFICNTPSAHTEFSCVASTG